MQGAIIFSFVWGIVCFGLACLNIPGMRKGNPVSWVCFLVSWVCFLVCAGMGVLNIVRSFTYL